MSESKERTLNKVCIPFTADSGKYELTCSSNCWIISKVTKSKKHGTTSTGIKFYTNLESCLQGVLDLKVKGMYASSLEELSGNISRAQKAISNMYKLTVDLDELEDAV